MTMIRMVKKVQSIFSCFYCPVIFSKVPASFSLLWFNGKDVLLLVWASQCYETEVMYTQQLLQLMLVQ